VKPHYVNPESLGVPKGYSNGILFPAGGRPLFVAGQVAWDEHQRLVGAGDFAAQFAQALTNFLTVVRAAGGTPESVGSMTVFVTDKAAYLASLRSLGPLWRERMGRHFPAMALVQVAGLVEDGALVEIQGIAWVAP